MKFVVNTLAETHAAAAVLAAEMRPGAIIALEGDLGSGKTEFVKALASSLGLQDVVTSPTFTLVHEYRNGPFTLYHLDLYRLETESELDEIAFDEYLLGPAVTAIEWADRFPHRIPADAVRVRITLLNGERRSIEW